MSAADKSTGRTPAQRKAAERQRHRDAGRVPVVIHVLPQFRPSVRHLEAQLRASEHLAELSNPEGLLVPVLPDAHGHDGDVVRLLQRLVPVLQAAAARSVVSMAAGDLLRDVNAQLVGQPSISGGPGGTASASFSTS